MAIPSDDEDRDDEDCGDEDCGDDEDNDDARDSGDDAEGDCEDMYASATTLSGGWAGLGQGQFCRPVPWPSGYGPANLTRAPGQLDPGPVGSGRVGPGSTLTL